MRIGLFGGSFDPVHAGHVYLVQTLQKALQLDTVIIFPARVSPFKLAHPPTARGEERMEMLRLAFSGEKGVKFSACELKREGASYTIDTIRELKEKHPYDEFYLLLTEDAKERFSDWRESSEIKKMCTVVFGSKKGEISSTSVRNALKKGEECKDFLSPKVLDYIKKKGLYS